MDLLKRTPEEEHHRQNQLAKKDTSGKLDSLVQADGLIARALRRNSVKHPFYYAKPRSKIV